MASPTQPSPSAIYATVSTISHDSNHSSSGGNDHANHDDGHAHIRGGSSSGGGYKRASRKGAPRRFQCEHAGCDKIYSRAEHLQRHQLNHNPREIYRCDVSDCNQKFVRLDLLSRHKKRHSATYTSRNRVPSFDVGDNAPVIIKSSACRQAISTSKPSQPPFYPLPAASSGPHDAAILLTPESNNGLVSRTSQSAAWASSLEERPGQASVMRQRPSFYGADAAVSLPDSSDMVSFGHVPAYPSDDALGQGNFAAWLFDPQTTYEDFGVASLPFLEGGLESAFNNNIHYDYESLTSLSPMDLPSRHVEGSEDWISEARRQELLQWFLIFLKKQPSFDARMPNLVLETAGDMSAPTLEMMRDCLREFWDTVSPRLPIVHQHTFSPSQCPVFLLLVMLALGASSLRSRDTSGQLAEYGAFADLIISCVRWEILTSDDSTPPASLWVAQALLLLEFYEKLLTSRKLHERAHIYHPAYLTLLRRGSPLIGKTGSESPPEPDCLGPDGGTASINLDSRTWWARWAETESMHRVVFAAFMLDIIHAAMFGHAADMAAHEIRLPLPCDDNLWTASSPDVVRQLDANFRMYGVRQVSFLDGLKSALHGKEVMTHSFGRMIIISGLLSVGWHLNHRETHLKWLDLRVPPADETQDSWRRLLLRAFDGWKDSFDVAMSQTLSDPAGNGPISSASVLYHLAHMSLHADIVDCQVYAGARRLLGRKVSSRDYANAVKRMTVWAKQASTRHAILHAFRLLQRVLVDQPRQRAAAAAAAVTVQQVRYSVKMDTDPHRPWITYYAVLAIWAFVRALGSQATRDGNKHNGNGSGNAYARMAEYVSGVARLAELDEATAAGLHEGLPGLLDVMEDILQEADTELLAEARQRLRTCKEMLAA